MNGRAPTESVEGLVEATNPKGLKIQGQWVNVSQFHPIENMPETGARVRLEVDAKGYIREVQVLDSPSVTPTARDERITRLAVLKAAANFVGLMGQSREDVKAEHVLVLADKWLAWVEQP
jgi:hypothetical protein